MKKVNEDSRAGKSRSCDQRVLSLFENLERSRQAMEYEAADSSTNSWFCAPLSGKDPKTRKNLSSMERGDCKNVEIYEVKRHN